MPHRLLFLSALATVTLLCGSSRFGVLESARGQEQATPRSRRLQLAPFARENRSAPSDRPGDHVSATTRAATPQTGPPQTGTPQTGSPSPGAAHATGTTLRNASNAVRGRQPLPLAPPAKRDATTRDAARKPLTTGGVLTTAISSLALVLGLFFLSVYVMRRSSGSQEVVLPSEAFEVLGRAPLLHRQQVQLIRLGNKLLLLSVGAGGAETLAEITDAEEVQRLAGLCREAHPNSISASFRSILTQFTRESSATGFLGEEEAAAPETPRRRTRPSRSLEEAA